VADEIDRAQIVNEAFQEDVLAAHLRRARKPTVADSALICIDCERPIPARRRAAVPGCTRCVECQAEYEQTWRLP